MLVKKCSNKQNTDLLIPTGINDSKDIIKSEKSRHTDRLKISKAIE